MRSYLRCYLIVGPIASLLPYPATPVFAGIIDCLLFIDF